MILFLCGFQQYRREFFGHEDHGIVSGLELVVAPLRVAAVFCSELVERAGRRRRAVDERFGQRVRRRVHPADRLREATIRVAHLALSGKGDVLGLHDAPKRRRRRLDEAGALALLAETRGAFRHDVIESALAVLGHEGVEVDQAPDALGTALRRAGHHHPAVAVAEEHHVAQILHLHERYHVLDLNAEIDVGAREVGALAHAGEGRREHLVAGAPQDRAYCAPLPAAGPGAVHEDEGAHDLFSGRLCIQASNAATTASGCSGTRAWPASGTTDTVTRSPSSSRRSFAVSRGLKASCSAWRSRSGAPPAPHHSSCGVASPAARWLAFTSGWKPSSHALASWPGAKNAKRRYFSRSAPGSEVSAHFVTASARAFG